MQPLVNKWWEIQVLSDRSLDELVFWRLQNFGAVGTATQVKGDEVLVRAYLPVEKASWLDLAALSLWLRQDAIAIGYDAPKVRSGLINEEDWSSSWKQHWQPQEIGDLFEIYPAWIDVPADLKRLPIRIDPGSAFGTGAHATTQLCLEALEFRMWDAKKIPNFTVADIGCGSGVLGIGAILLGAAKVYAVDLDILGIKATNHNRELNNISPEKIWVEEGSLGHLLKNIPEPVRGFTCNIQADVILDMIPYLSQLVRPDGWGILSGILVDQVPMVAGILDEHKWIVATVWKKQDWSCLTVRRA